MIRNLAGRGSHEHNTHNWTVSATAFLLYRIDGTDNLADCYNIVPVAKPDVGYCNIRAFCFDCIKYPSFFIM